MKRVMITAAAFFLLAPLGLLFVSSNTPRLAVSSSNGTDFEKKEVGDATHEEAEWWLLGWRGEDGELPAGNPLPEVIAQREEFLASQVDSQGFGSDGTARLHWVPRGPQNVGGRTRALVIHPIDPNIMWAASASGGIWKTSDGGANWFAGNGPIGNLGILSLAIHPADPDILYAGTGEEFPGGGIFKSEDGGDTWSAFPLNDTAGWGHISRISVAYIPGSPTPTTHLLVATDGAGINTQGIRRSTDGGTTWTREVSDALDARFVSFDPTSSTNAVGEVLFQCPNPPCHALHRAVFSTDGGDTWDTSTISDGDNPAEDFINNPNGRVEFAYSASETNTVYALYKPNGSNGARLAKSENGGGGLRDNQHPFRPGSRRLHQYPLGFTE